jgi:orotate phosphoribosyltransferase
MELPVIHRAPKKDWHNFLGYKIASSVGISARANNDSKAIWLAARSGYDVLTSKTVRCYEHDAHPSPNIRYVQRVAPLTYDDIGTTIMVSNNKPENIAEIAVANSFGNPSMDSDWTRNDIKKAKQSLLEGQVLIVSVFGNMLEEWKKAAQLAVESGADIIEANFSCPNLNTNNEPIYTRPDDIFVIADHLVQTVTSGIPILIKCGIFTNLSVMKSALIAAAKAGVRGIVGINSVPMKVVNKDGTPTFGTRIMAGISGAPIHQLALDFIKRASTIIRKENLNLVLLGVGGITMPSHFSDFLKLGAVVALSATGMMSNPSLAAEYHEKLSLQQLKKQELARQLSDIGVIKLGDFILKSGIRSNDYIDMRLAISHPNVLQALAVHLKAIQQKCQTDLLCAVPYGAIPVTTALSLASQIPMVMARKEAKNHGTKKMIEGVYAPGQTCLIIEDVVTTGASTLEAIQTVEAAGLRVKDVIALIDRQQGGAENISGKGYRFHALFTLQELLSLLKKPQELDQKKMDELKSLVNEQKNFYFPSKL